MRALALVACLVLAPSIAAACVKAPPCVATKLAKRVDVAMLESKDDAVVAQAAVTLAASPDAAHLAAIAAVLRQSTFLERVMGMKNGRRCVMPELLRALAENPNGRKFFVALIGTEQWTANSDLFSTVTLLQTELLRASALVRPPPKEIVAWWKQLSQPNDSWTGLTISVAAENASPEGAARFEQIIRDKRHSTSDRVAWLHDTLVQHRHELEVLKAARRLLAAKLGREVRAGLVEGVFDFQEDWFPLCNTPTPASFESFEKPVADELRAFAKGIENEKLGADLAAKVAAAISQLP